MNFDRVLADVLNAERLIVPRFELAVRERELQLPAFAVGLLGDLVRDFKFGSEGAVVAEVVFLLETVQPVVDVEADIVLHVGFEFVPLGPDEVRPIDVVDRRVLLVVTISFLASDRMLEVLAGVLVVVVVDDTFELLFAVPTTDDRVRTGVGWPRTVFDLVVTLQEGALHLVGEIVLGVDVVHRDRVAVFADVVDLAGHGWSPPRITGRLALGNSVGEYWRSSGYRCWQSRQSTRAVSPAFAT